MSIRHSVIVVIAILALNSVYAQPHAPIVTISISLPDGRTQELTAPESGLVTTTTKDGVEYGFKPTILDSKPWNQITIAIFRMATAKETTSYLGEVELKRGGPAVASKTNPSFKIAVPKVDEPSGPSA
jgi:hypothetical protein